MILDSGVLDVNISDHELVYLIRKKSKEFIGRSYYGYDRDVFVRNLENATWDTFYENNDPNILWEIFLKIPQKTIDELCPQKTFKIKKYKDPWLSNDNLEFTKDKDRSLKKAKRTKLPTNWKIAQQLRNECLGKIRKAKSDFIQNELNKNMNNSTNFWKKY